MNPLVRLPFIVNAQLHARQQIQGALCGLLAAVLFGLSAPLAKLLLARLPPVLLAGLLYLGAAGGLWLHRLFAHENREPSISRADWGNLAVLVATGGVIAPVLMLVGLNQVTALAGALLLNLEAPFTILLAVFLFQEHLGRHARVAVALVVVGAMALNFEPGELGGSALGVALLSGACACWALDNNLTQRLTLHDPFAVVRAKTTAAGLVNTALGLAVTSGANIPIAYLVGALVLGSLSYGVSVVLDAYALRLVGAAREAAYFATAPFVGALIAIVGLGDPLHWYAGVSMAVMGAGVVLLMRERHSHVHEHPAIEHEHLHEHDEHHRHGHSPAEPHSHPHRHERLIHEHPHVPDAHHRHPH